MEVIYVLIPGMILLGIILVLVLAIAIRKGQYDDLEGDGARILMDDDLMPDDLVQRSSDRVGVRRQPQEEEEDGRG